MLNVFIILIECTHTTELSTQIHAKPMVHNPIYEGGVIYEEIPDVSNFRSVSHKKKDLAEREEEGYVSIANQTSSRSMEFPKLEECNTVSMHHLLLLRYIIPHVGRIINKGAAGRDLHCDEFGWSITKE